MPAIEMTISYSPIDPLGQPTVTAGSDHCFLTCCPSVRHHFSKSSKTKQSMFATGETVGLAEWIISYSAIDIVTCIQSNITLGNPYRRQSKHSISRIHVLAFECFHLIYLHAILTSYKNSNPKFKILSIFSINHIMLSVTLRFTKI